MATKKKNTSKSNKLPDNSAEVESAATEIEPPPVFPVVGIGASAGGLGAFRELLKGLPIDTGMAFVVVQHLDPHHESLLVSLLASCTKMPVCEAQDNMRVKPNHIYVIPPDTSMGFLHDTLQLVKRQREAGRYLPVDWFLRSLAEDRGTSAIGVILTGTASDGTLGLKEIKTAGGITFAQDNESAEYFGMPGSAIAAGCVDFVMPPLEIAREICRIARHPFLQRQRLSARAEISQADNDLNKVFLLLRSRTGHDFTYYKHTTIKRRIKRRMLLHKLEQFSDYVRLLERNPTEVDGLFQDVLINVTSFFRDPEAFEALFQAVFPKLLDNHPKGTPIRIWVPGCSTGEEAYTVAIALLEYLESRVNDFTLQIFASDIDDQAIKKARQGIYPERITEELSAGRLHRFFVKVSGGYQVSKSIRDLCIFAEQDITKDPPFSKLDLVCCRNLLIYLGSMLQKKVLQMFHYALQPGGFLMLGTSETIGGHADLFHLLDKKNKLYTKKSIATRSGYEFKQRPFFYEAPATTSPQPGGQPLLYDLQQEAEQVVLAQYGPPGVVINGDMEILHFRGETGPYLNPIPGSASLNLLKMARQELAVELRPAVRKASKEGQAVRKHGILLTIEGKQRCIDLQIIPLRGPIPEERCMLVLFESADSAVAGEPSSSKGGKENSVHRKRTEELEQELAASREYMQSIIEDQETSNEELRSANEEIQSSNEELQSTNEELETAKEELQSTNEELATVNEELESRNIELTGANNDLTNLLASVNLPILMLSEDLRIRQFTPQAEKLLNLIGSDLGRPFDQIRANIDIPDMAQIVGEVVDTMTTKSLEIRDHDGHWHKFRARPYKTVDNHIEGVVITFIDIDDIKDAEQLRKMQSALLESEERLRAVINNSTTAIFVKDLDGRYLLANKTVEALVGLTGDRILGRTDHELFDKHHADLWSQNDKEVLRRMVAQEFEETISIEEQEHTFLSVKFPLTTEDDKVYGIGGISTDITGRANLHQTLQRLAAVVRDANDAVIVLGLDGSIEAWNPAATRIYGWSEHEALGMNIRDIVAESDYSTMLELLERVRGGETPEMLEVSRLTKTGESLRMRMTVSLLMDDKGAPKAVAITERQIT